MVHFDKDYASFFRELEKNNSKEWFDQNRKRYEKNIKIPFKNFMTTLAEHLQEFYPEADLSTNFSVMRINRDIRFSADKTPYKIHMAGMVMPGGVKDKTRPGLYVQVNHKDIRVYSGSMMLEKEQLQAIREYIADHLDEFNKLISDKNFTEIFGEISGEKNKRLPKEFQETSEIQPLIANKEFYWFFKIKSTEITSNNLVDILVDKFQTTLPLNSFFEKALGYKS